MSNYPAIPDASTSPQSILQSVQALTEAVRLLTGQRGDESSHAATKQSLKVIEDKVNTTTTTTVKSLQDDIDEAKRAFDDAVGNLYKAIADWLAGLSSVDDDIKVQLNTLDSKVGDNEAAITQANVTRANADLALAGQITSLTSTVNNNNAAFNSFTLTQSTRNDALTGQLTSLSTNVNNNNTAISQEVIARSTADTALGTRIDNLTSVVNGNTATIASEATTRANSDSAISQQVSTLSSTVGTHTSQISTLTSSVDGVSVSFGVSGVVDGSRGGFVFQGVKKLDGTGATFNTIFDSNVTINGTLIVNGTTPTAALAPNAVTTGGSAAGFGLATTFVNVPAGGWVLAICSLEQYLPLIAFTGSQFYIRGLVNGSQFGASAAAPVFYWVNAPTGTTRTNDYAQQTRVFSWQNTTGIDLNGVAISCALTALDGSTVGASCSLSVLVFKR